MHVMKLQYAIIILNINEIYNNLKLWEVFPTYYSTLK